jgi:protein-S-isoprenylcysteine O-methyltransferase Ste14
MIPHADHERVIARMKRRALAWMAVMLAVTLALVGMMFARIEANVDDVERVIGATVAQTVLTCERGNELRRAVRAIANEQARDRRASGRGFYVPQLDPDALVIQSCRETAIRVTGIDPGPVGDFVP